MNLSVQNMIELDSPTLIIAQAIVQWLLAILLMAERGMDKGTKYWVIALFIHGIANLLLFSRPYLPPVVAVIFYNFCVTTAFSFSYLAFARLVGKQAPLWLVLFPIFVMILTMSIYIDDIAMRVIFASIITGTQLILMAFVLTRGNWSGSEKLKGWLMYSTGLFGVGFIVRALFCYVKPELFIHLVAKSSFQSGLVIAGMIYIIFSTVVILLVRLDRLNKELSTLASQDSLTGLFNRRAFMHNATSIIASENFPVSVLMLDLDNFKKINDVHGHNVGDTVLKLCADALQDGLKQYGIIGRFGGEEFAAILPRADSEQALAVSEKLRLAIETINVNPDIRLSISIGVATSSSVSSIEPLLIRADKALYEAKSKGRNQVIHADLLALN
ncbi:GGDEF domain-containing protein [Shewanella baltica]|nr:GGDEF domain-containing protein [Shewanella baltica]MCS6162048.1 GGDEF domain-containing protein [Shewanella baltica]MCS6228252.1 GGDEF domain-containing protein [Shewanella baltica]